MSSRSGLAAFRTTNPKLKSNREAGEWCALLLAFALPFLSAWATLAWQSHGGEATEIIRARAPSLSWLLPSSTRSPLDGQASTAAGASSAELAQQLRPVMLELATMRQGIDQLAATMKQLSAKQEKMAQDISILPAIEQDVREKLASPAQPRTPAPRKPSQQSSAPQPSIVSPELPASGPPLRLQESHGQSAR